ncbi:MAG TPA: ABC transporter ATP-binding protein [Negativicutes bacterium]|nr:ABC transporter ATP-binding protein [Negativicutes bacterium]
MSSKINHLEMRDIVKRFPGVLSNDHVSIDIAAGEVLALLGENGAGKTTLMNVLYGLYQPDEGSILINGEAVHIESPRSAIDKGIGMVHQHFMLVPTLTVCENVALGMPSDKGALLDLEPVARKIVEIGATYGVSVNPNACVWQLSVGEQQRVEIIKALYRGADLLIMDEPTAVLTPQEAQDLISLLKIMAKQGRSVIIISHKLNEVMEVSDKVVVLRDGKKVGAVNTRSTNPEELARMMVGRDSKMITREHREYQGECVLCVEDLCVTNNMGTPALRSISLGVRPGEILGIAGVSGNGQKEFAEAISGLRPVDAGKILLSGEEITNCSPKKIIDKGLGYVPEDRLHVGTIPSFNIWENLLLKDHANAPFAKCGFLNASLIRTHSETLVSEYDIKTPDLETATGKLSGGNIQRLILAREITRQPKVLVAAYPTRGLDIGAAEYVHEMLLNASMAGMGIILISEELDEVQKLSDRVAVFFDGRIMDVLPAEAADEKTLGLLMAGLCITKESISDNGMEGKEIG